MQLTAAAISSDGSSRVVTTDATWESSNPAIAAVQAGLVAARAEGSTTITARFGGKEGTHRLTIERRSVPSTGLACGVERWAVKTLSDSGASSVDLSRVHATTIRALNELPTRCSALPSTRTYEPEFQVYEVVGRITYVKLQDDRDYHVVVADVSDHNSSIVTEVTDPECSGAINSPHRDAIAQARSAFMAMLTARAPSDLVGTVVRLRGVGFYDFDHGQIGRSRNCMELHPIVSIERAQ